MVKNITYFGLPLGAEVLHKSRLFFCPLLAEGAHDSLSNDSSLFFPRVLHSVAHEFQKINEQALNIALITDLHQELKQSQTLCYEVFSGCTRPAISLHKTKSYLGIQLLLPSSLYMPMADGHFDPASKGEINGCDLGITGINNDVPRLPVSFLLTNLQQAPDL